MNKVSIVANIVDGVNVLYFFPIFKDCQQRHWSFAVIVSFWPFSVVFQLSRKELILELMSDDLIQPGINRPFQHRESQNLSFYR